MLAAAAFVAASASSFATAEMTKMVGGAAMCPSNHPERGELERQHDAGRRCEGGGLVDTLEGPGPFTVFAPTKAAFKELPPGTVDNLLKPENKGDLAGVLIYHVLPGRITAEDLAAAIKQGGGQATIKTVQGEPLTFSEKGKSVEISDSKGRMARITISDVMQSNGVIHVINKVLLP
jgi:uncharacterized surface protein with fasciclin (FAS1) repeats